MPDHVAVVVVVVVVESYWSAVLAVPNGLDAFSGPLSGNKLDTVNVRFDCADDGFTVGNNGQIEFSYNFVARSLKRFAMCNRTSGQNVPQRYIRTGKQCVV